jgi:hypothetical protein
MTETNARELLEGDVFPQDLSFWAVGPHGYNVASDGYIEVACYEMVDIEKGDEHSDKLVIKRIFEPHGVDVIRNIGGVRVASKAGKVEAPENSTPSD